MNNMDDWIRNLQKCIEDEVKNKTLHQVGPNQYASNVMVTNNISGGTSISIGSKSIGSNNKVTGPNNHVPGSNNTVIGNDNNVPGCNNIVKGTKNYVAGSNNDVIGSYNKVYGSNNVIKGSGHTIYGSNETIKGSGTTPQASFSKSQTFEFNYPSQPVNRIPASYFCAPSAPAMDHGSGIATAPPKCSMPDYDYDRSIPETKPNNEPSSIGRGESSASASGSKRECPICYEELETRHPLALLCGHVVCKPCVQTLIRNNMLKCPICTQEFRPSDARPIFL